MSHYETLGVPPVNKAYDVLSDAARRKRYDETGDDGQLPSVEKEALHTVVEWFRQALEKDGNIVLYVRRQLAAARNGARAQASESNKKADRLRRRRVRIKVKSGSNLVHGIIDSQVADLMDVVKQCAHIQEVADAAEKLIDQYESDEPEDTGPDLRDALGLMLSAAAAKRYSREFP
jgi:curved DNA-binding protein CbpA